MNDAEINYLADLYLACFKLDRSERAYRRFKNAVILTSDGSVTFRDACRAIGEVEQKSENAVSSAIIRALKNLPAPADEIFNRHTKMPPTSSCFWARRFYTCVSSITISST